MIITILKIIANQENRQEILDILRSMEGQTRAQHGCMDCGIYEEYGESQSILYMEQWSLEEELQNHIRSNLYRRVLAAMELAIEPPIYCIHMVSETKGLELIESLRTSRPVVNE